MRNLKVIQMGDVFLATMEDCQFMIQLQPEGFSSTVLREGEPVKKELISTHEEETLELVHESLVEQIINEVFQAIETPEELDEVTDELDKALGEPLLKMVEGGKLQ